MNSSWRPWEPSREAVYAAWTRLECSIVGERCVVHDCDGLSCSHRCDESSDWEHSEQCDDPPPPVMAASFDDNCIGCGLRIREGAPVRRYEEGYVHADGCPERPQS